VLLQNDGTLPLTTGKRVAVVGPMGVERTGMVSDYGNGDWRRQNACYNAAAPGTQGESGKSGAQGEPYCLPTIAESIARANVGGKTTVQMGVRLEHANAGIAAATQPRAFLSHALLNDRLDERPT
jgi:hypothetical protein